MAQLGAMFRQGILKPIDNVKTFDIADLEQAITYLHSAQRVRKAMLTSENSQSRIKVSQVLNFLGYLYGL